MGAPALVEAPTATMGPNMGPYLFPGFSLWALNWASRVNPHGTRIPGLRAHSVNELAGEGLAVASGLRDPSPGKDFCSGEPFMCKRIDHLNLLTSM